MNGTVFAADVKIYVIRQCGENSLQVIPAVHQLSQPDLFRGIHKKNIKIMSAVLILHQPPVILNPQYSTILAADPVFHVVVCTGCDLPIDLAFHTLQVLGMHHASKRTVGELYKSLHIIASVKL